GQLAGDLRPDAGMTRFAGQDVTSLDAPTRSRLGLARSFQITSIFRDFTAVDNVALAVQAHSGHSFRFWRPARAERALRDPALAVLDSVGLGDRADVLAANLAHGEQRQLEIAMALATRPRPPLLDEPGGDAPRQERHGQDDHRALHHGDRAAEGRRRPVTRPDYAEPAVLPRRADRDRPRAGGPPGLSDPHRAREPRGDRREPRRRH